MIQLDAEWNNRTALFRHGIQKRFPGLLDGSGTPSEDEALTDSIASRIFAARSDDDLEETKKQMIGLLNYLETLAVAYQHRVADARIFQSLYSDVIIRWHDALKPFIDAVNEVPNRQPPQRDPLQWAALTQVANEFRASKVATRY